MEEYADEKTSGFSGADLQALLYNSHLESVHESLVEVERGREGKEGMKVEYVVSGGKNIGSSKAENVGSSKAENAALENRVCSIC